MSGTGSIGAFAGGLSEALQGGLNSAAARANTAARTAATQAGTAQFLDDIKGHKEVGAWLRDVQEWEENGRQGPRPVPPGASSRRPIVGFDERPQIANALRQQNFHALADGILAPGTDDQVPMVTQPAPNSAGMGLTQPTPAIPNLTQITNQAVGPATGLKRYGVMPQTFGA